MSGLNRDELRIVAVLVLGLLVGSGVKLYQRFFYQSEDGAVVGKEFVEEFDLRARQLESQQKGISDADHQDDIAAVFSAQTADVGLGSDSGSSVFPIDLNRAKRLELMALPKIGPVLAGRIVDYREANGSFVRIDDLIQVKGVGRQTLESLRPFLLPITN